MLKFGELTMTVLKIGSWEIFMSSFLTDVILSYKVSCISLKFDPSIKHLLIWGKSTNYQSNKDVFQ